MKKYPAFFLLGAFLCVGFALIYASGQEKSARLDNDQGEFKIQVGVEEVRIDAVVVDKSGRQITNLTAKDFELYQDGHQQQLSSCLYIPNTRAVPVIATYIARDPSNVPAIAPRPLKRDEISRTIVFLVDDLSMASEDIHFARKNLEKFIKTQMQDGDLIAIVQSKQGNTGAPPFTASKRELLAKIENIHFTLGSSPSVMRQQAAFSYYLGALQDMPGRKFLFFVSTETRIPGPLLENRMFYKLADEALRAGVVIHTVDVSGPLNDSVQRKVDENGNEEFIPLDADTRYSENAEEKEVRKNAGIKTASEKRLQKVASTKSYSPMPLSRKTGGLYLTGNSPMADMAEEMKGYYLLSYAPPPDTFSPADPAVYHKVTIKVKRSNAEVHARDGFFGETGSPKQQNQNKNPLIQAIFSPFKSDDLKIDFAAAYVGVPQQGNLLFAWAHLDGRQIGIINEKDGGHSINLEAIAIATDINGVSQDSGNTKIAFPVNDEQIRRIRENGIIISLSLPSKPPGEYYVRAAIKDNASGAIGSAYQFVEIPDLHAARLALSSIFLIENDDDVRWIQSGLSAADTEKFNRSQTRGRWNQALKNFSQGDAFEYMSVLYAKEADQKLDLELQYMVFRDGVEIFKSLPEKIAPGDQESYERIPIKRRLLIDKTFEPGDYELVLQAKDRGASERNIATQTLSFSVLPKAAKETFPQLRLSYEAPAEIKPATEMTNEELRRLYREELNSVEFVKGQDQLDEILKNVGANVVNFFRDFFNVSAKEKVEKVARRRIFGSSYLTREYKYLILPGKTEDTWIEDRVDKNGTPIDPKSSEGFMMNSGYAGYSLYLHPKYQEKSVFRYLGREIKKPRAHVIAFAQRRDSDFYIAQYAEKNLSNPVRYLVHGFVWVDPDSYQILRIRSGMLAPERLTNLKDMKTDIFYENMKFKNSKEFWLPREIRAEWDLPDSIYSNKHTYSDYRMFEVETDYKIALPEAPIPAK